MQLQVVLIVVLTVQLCNSHGINNNRKFVSQKPKAFRFSNFNNSNIDPNVKEDTFLSATQLISKYGYPVEKYDVTTKDGYILEIHRIPKPGAIPVLLCHGLLSDSSTWLLMGPNKGFPYFLYDNGYDVWMINARGNTYSRRHVTLNPSQPEFWNFSFHEIGIYDIPATIDFILRTTNYKRLHYIGHSQGGTTFFIMCSLRPEYNKKIISMQGLAPAVFLNGKNPIVEVATLFQDQIANYFMATQTYEFLPTSNFIKTIGSHFCRDGKRTQIICSNIIFLFAGFDEDQINSTMLPVIVGQNPAGSSFNQILHFSQIKRSGRFRQFDYGTTGNLKKYGRKTPPDYDFSKVTAKVAIYYGANDYFIATTDIDKLAGALPNVVGTYLVDFPKFNHIDFVWAIDARELVYSKVIKSMRLIENGRL